MQMTKSIEYQCIHCHGTKGKFKTQEEAEKHYQEYHSNEGGM